MKAMIGSGLCLALALVSPWSFAEEVNWRRAVPTLGTPAPAATSAVTPVAYSSPTPAPSSTLGIGLGRPIAVAGQDPEKASPPAFRSDGLALDRPLPLIRGQAPDFSVQPLPVGLPLKGENGKQEPKGKASPQAVKPAPMTLESEFVSPMPRVMQEAAPSGSYCCGQCTPVWSRAGAGPIIDGGGIVSMGECGTGCFNDCCDCCPDDCCEYRGNRVYASASYLGWSFKRKNVPPLVTVSPVGTPAATTGVLGLRTTLVVADESTQEDTYHSGGRFNFGFWFAGGNWGLEADYFFLSTNSNSVLFGSNGDPQFARPVIIGGRETVQFVSLPGVVTGNVSVNMFSKMWGMEVNARQKLFCGPRFWVDMLYGYRHLDLSEGIDIGEDLVQLNPAGNLGIRILDQFHTRNTFNGPQIGIQGEYHFLNRFFVGSTFKLAMGNMHEQVNINGSIAYTPLPNGQTTAFNTGILANGTNVGNHQSDRFAVIPEMNFKIGYDINDHWRVWAGYDFLFVSSVVRPGDQIDRRLNPSQIPLPPPGGAQPLVGAPVPAVLFRTTSFYAQGVSFGLQYRW